MSCLENIYITCPYDDLIFLFDAGISFSVLLFLTPVNIDSVADWKD